MSSARFEQLLRDNETWATEAVRSDPEYFQRRVNGQQPTFLFLGCSDSRVPAEVITGAQPGELFVHRNIANIAANGDLGVLAVLTFAVEVLKVEEILVCGHQGCGGVAGALQGSTGTLVDHWLTPIRATARAHAEELAALPDDDARRRRLVELNVETQVASLAGNAIVARARETRPLPIHGLVYDLADGRLAETVRNV